MTVPDTEPTREVNPNQLIVRLRDTIGTLVLEREMAGLALDNCEAELKRVNSLLADLTGGHMPTDRPPGEAT